MNNTQLKYAATRLDQVCREKLAKAREQCVKKSKPFDGPALIAAIKSGKITAKSRYVGVGISTYTDVSEVFAGITDLIKPNVIDSTEYDKIAAIINAEAIKTSDQLYLGDAKEALALIEAFAAKKF